MANLSYALKSGILPSGDAFGGSMAEVVTHGTAFLSNCDREAIATYLLDPDGTGIVPSPEIPTAATPMAASMEHSTTDMTDEN